MRYSKAFTFLLLWNNLAFGEARLYIQKMYYLGYKAISHLTRLYSLCVARITETPAAWSWWSLPNVNERGGLRATFVWTEPEAALGDACSGKH